MSEKFICSSSLRTKLLFSSVGNEEESRQAALQMRMHRGLIYKNKAEQVNSINLCQKAA